MYLYFELEYRCILTQFWHIEILKIEVLQPDNFSHWRSLLVLKLFDWLSSIIFIMVQCSIYGDMWWIWRKKRNMQILSLISKNQKTSLHSSLSFYTPYKNLYSKGFPFCALCPNDKQWFKDIREFHFSFIYLHPLFSRSRYEGFPFRALCTSEKWWRRMGADKDESWGIALGNPHFFLQKKVWFDGKKSDTRI